MDVTTTTIRLCPVCGRMTNRDTCPRHNVRAVEVPSDPSTDALKVGATFAGRFVIGSKLGAGAMGAVYRARDGEAGRDVALKVLHPAMVQHRDSVQRFYREAAAARLVRSPHVVELFAFGLDESAGVPWLAMELLEGDSLGELLDAQGAQPVSRSCLLLSYAASALVEASRHGVVHRDLKPDNLFVVAPGSPAETLRVVDFGVALARQTASGAVLSALTATGMTLGTPAYMAPEQVQGEEVDGRADLYAIGCVLHELLTGQPPYVGGGGIALATMHVLGDMPELPEVLPSGETPSPALVELHAGLLEKTRALRISDPLRVQRVLEALATDDERRAMDLLMGAPLAPGTPDPSENRVAFLAALAVIGLAVVGTLWWVTRPAPEPQQAPPAVQQVQPQAPAPAADPHPEPPKPPTPVAAPEPAPAAEPAPVPEPEPAAETPAPEPTRPPPPRPRKKKPTEYPW